MKTIITIALAFVGFFGLISASYADDDAGNLDLLNKARNHCAGSVSFYAVTDTGNILLKELCYSADSLSPNELNVAHALENEILLLFLRKGYYLDSVMCGYSEEKGQTERVLFLVHL